MFESINQYVLNKKDRDAIVYTDAFGNVIRVTKDDFASEEEFQKFKAWSDEDLHDEEKSRHIEADHTLSLDSLSEAAVTVQSIEEDYISIENNVERHHIKQKAMQLFCSCLTETQKRRYLLAKVEGLSTREIADRENVNQNAVWGSIHLVEKKMKRLLSK